MRKINIIGTGSFTPEKIVPNSYFEKIVNTTNEWITTRTGIEERRMIIPGEALSDLATPAAQRALEMANIPAEDLDLIVVGTSTPDMLSPSSACIIQNNLENKKAAAFDVNAACPGFIYGLSIAEKFIQDGSHTYALVIGSEIISNRIDYEDRGTCVLFGDGAGAVVLGPCNGNNNGEILSSHLHSDGSLWELLNIPGGGSRNPPSYDMLDERLHVIKMKGNEVFKYAVRTMVDVASEAMEKNSVSSEDIDWFIPHQANIRIMETVANRLKIPLEKMIVTIHKYGNTSAASIPVALDENVRSGQIKRGDLILVASFGAGFVWGAVLFRF
ncbi:MAG: ketoacyl-ACP synthase III [Deltaproteobacteria bacterium]|nr:ketoacyl-ACP synthase III [Deltaproteobacteria bacterium]